MLVEAWTEFKSKWNIYTLLGIGIIISVVIETVFSVMAEDSSINPALGGGGAFMSSIIGYLMVCKIYTILHPDNNRGWKFIVSAMIILLALQYGSVPIFKAEGDLSIGALLIYSLTAICATYCIPLALHLDLIDAFSASIKLIWENPVETTKLYLIIFLMILAAMMSLGIGGIIIIPLVHIMTYQTAMKLSNI